MLITSNVSKFANRSDLTLTTINLLFACYALYTLAYYYHFIAGFALMEDTIVPWSNIDPTLFNWTTIVQVIEVTHVIHIGESQTRYQQYAPADT